MHLKPSAQMGVSFHAHPLSIARRVIGQNTSSPLIGNIPPPTNSSHVNPAWHVE